MPEGDTIFKAAERLRAALVGRRLVHCDSPLESIAGAGLEGHEVVAVEARGKNLLVRFDDARVLHTHLRMKGAWHIWRAGDRLLRRTTALRVLLENDAWTAACFDAPVVRLLTEREEARDPRLTSLGPDVLADAFDPLEARRRLRADPAREIADALLDQRAVAGLGNVYKSELLFLRRVDPFARVADLDDATLDGLLAEAQRLMKRNLARGPRVTRNTLGRERHWVYERAGRPCFTCGEAIVARKQAERTTYFCPRCQRVA